MKKILMIRFGSLGDVILTTPVTKALKGRFAGHELHVLVKKEFAEVFRDSPYVGRIIEFDTNKYPTLKELGAFAKELNETGYDIVIDLHRNLRSRYIFEKLKAERKLSYKKGWLKRRLLVKFKIRFDNMPHTVDKYLAPLKSLGIDSADRLPFMCLSKENEAFADEFFSKEGISADTKMIAISPGAKNKSKMYPKEKFVKLANRIIDELGAHIIMIGSKTDEGIISEITEGINNKGKVSALTNGSIRQSAAVIKRCAKLVTNDSGPMHIAVAVGTPVIALFGPTDKRLGFYPLGENDIVLTKEYPCSPCSLHGKKECVKHHYKCLNDITEDEIFSIMSA